MVEFFRLLPGDGVHPVVVVAAEGGVLSLNFKISDKAGFRIADAAHLGVFYSGKGIGHAAHARDAESHQTAHRAVVKGHLAFRRNICRAYSG